MPRISQFQTASDLPRIQAKHRELPREQQRVQHDVQESENSSKAHTEEKVGAVLQLVLAHHHQANGSFSALERLYAETKNRINEWWSDAEENLVSDFIESSIRTNFE
jgi:hypothetical protein